MRGRQQPTVLGEPGLLGSPAFLRLWGIGAVANMMMWLEVLSAALYTLDATGSDFAVATVVAARSMPLVFMGAFAGVLADAIDRKSILLGGLLLMTASAAGVAGLAWAGALQPWHLVVANLASGLVYGTELSVRRRMVGESVPTRLVPRAIALDSLASSASRVLGPLIGGTLYQALGAAGAYSGSAACCLLAAVLATRVRHAQITRKMSVAGAFHDLAEAVGAVRAAPVLLAMLGATVAMNLFGFAYSSLVAPVGRGVFGVSDTLVGLLAATEPAGGTLGGLAIAALGVPPFGRIWMQLLGAGSFLALMMLIPLAPRFWAACLLLFVGGIGIAVYGNAQVTIALTDSPPAMRSRVMGLLTVAVGTWPFGMLLAGWLAGRLGPLWAMGALGGAGVVFVVGVSAAYMRRSR